MLFTRSRHAFISILATTLAVTLGWIGGGPAAAQAQPTFLDALNDLHLHNDATNAADNIDKLADAMVTLYQSGGGTIYFPAGTYLIAYNLRPLPGIAFVGADPATTIIKNIYGDNGETDVYWNGAVLFCGHDHPEEGYTTGTGAGQITFRRFTAIPQKGAKQVQVRNADYALVNKGDELKFLSGANATEKPGVVLRPNYMIKVVVVDKIPATNTLVFDRPLPWTFATVTSDQAYLAWGSVPKGQAAWMRVSEYYTTDQPKYWQRSNFHGYTAYQSLGAKWVKGWTSRRNTFKNLTLWSQHYNAMNRGMACDSVFENCIFKGQECIYGNSCQYTTFNNCTGYFSDLGSELSYNCLYTTFNNLTLAYDTAVSDPGTTTSMGIVNVHENSQFMVFNGLNILAAGRTMAQDNTLIRLAGANLEFRHVYMEASDISRVIYLCQHVDDSNTPGSMPCNNIRFRDVELNMPGHSFTTLFSITDGAYNVYAGGFKATAAASGNLGLGIATCHDIIFSDLAIPGALQMTANVKNVQALRCSFPGGITGAWAGNVKVVAGTPNYSLYK